MCIGKRDNAGTIRLLLLPPAGCNIVNLKSSLSFMGPQNTDLTSSNISASFIEEYNLILPIRPLLASSSLKPDLGIVTFPSARKELEYPGHTQYYETVL